jgi:hypothetical protein
MSTGPRFVVSSVTGVTINPATTRGKSSTDYYVLDRAYCHREVGRFASETYRNQGAAARRNQGAAARRGMAEAKAAELNAWDATL